MRTHKAEGVSWRLINDQGDEVCMAFVTEYQDTVTIHQLYTWPEYRRQGFATRLMKQIIVGHGGKDIYLASKQWADKDGPNDLELDIFYRQSLGMEEYKPGQFRLLQKTTANDA